MNNTKRSNSLFRSAFVYSIFTIVLLALAISKGSIPLLNWAMGLFVLTSCCIMSSIYFGDDDKDPSRTMIVVSFGLLMPLAMVIFTIAFGFELFKLIYYRIKGGDEYE